MTKEEIDIMWQQAMQESIKEGEIFTRYHFAEMVAQKALAEHAMREVQRLGQEIEQDADSFCDSNCVWTDHHPDCKLAQPEQEPVGHREGYWCVDLTCKKCYSADFRLKHTTPPQRTEEKNT